MFSLRKVPTEIIQDILGHLDFPDLLELQLTCKEWSQITQRLIYTNVIFKDTKLSTFNAYFATLSADTGGELSKLANSFSIRPSYRIEYNSFEEDTIQALFDDYLVKFCPNITNLFGGTMMLPISFWNRLRVAVENNRLAYVVSLPDSYRVFQDHTFVTEHYQGQLTYLSLEEYDLRIYDENGDNWPYLSRLKVIVTSSHGISEFDAFINRCPSLVSLEFHPDDGIDYREHWDSDFGIFEDEYNQNGSYVETKLDLSKVSPSPSIRNLKGYIVIISGESLNYFMHKFPQLNNLDLYIGCDFPPSGYEEEDDFVFEDADSFHFTADIMTRFFDYVLEMSSFCVTNIRLANTEEVLADYINKKEFSGIIEIAYFQYRSHNDEFLLWTKTNPRLKLDNNCMDYYRTPNVNQKRITVEFTKCTDLPEDLEVLPHTAFIEKIQGSVKQLRLGRSYDSLLKRLDDERFYRIVPTTTEKKKIDRYSLNHIFHHCSSLKRLMLDYLELISCDDLETIKGINKSIEILEISRSRFAPAILTEFSARLNLLKQLYLIDSRNSSENRQDLIQIHMPHNSLDTIFCQWSLGDLRTDVENIFYLKLVTDGAGEQFFVGDGTELATCSFEKYEESLEKKDLLSIDIHCKELKLLWLKLADASSKKVPSLDQKCNF